MDVLRTDDFLRTKISWKHRLPYFLTHGASLDVGQGWLCLNSNREWVWCHVIMVTKFLHLNNTCLTEMAIWGNKQWKKSLGHCRFVPEWNHVHESHTCQFFFLPHLDHGLLRCRNFATKGQGLYLSVTFFVELIIGRGSYIQCMKRLRKGENICVLFENPTHCSIGTAWRRNKCREDHGSYRCSSQSRNCVFNCNDLLCI